MRNGDGNHLIELEIGGQNRYGTIVRLAETDTS